MTRNESRIEKLREQETREEEWIFEEPDAMAIPETVKSRFDNEGMALRWIRVSLQGKDDISNVGKKMQAGWSFVSPEEVPEMSLTSFVRDEGRYQGAVCRGDVALVKMPAGKVTARRNFYEKKANDQMDAVNAQLMKNSDSRMPITNSSRSVTTKGRLPSFQE